MPEKGTRRSSDTRGRIIAIASELFARQGYTGTSISDIARELGTTTAALYYHFSSKADILDALFADPLAAYSRFVEQATAGRSTPEALLGAFLDLTTESGGLVPVISADLTVMRMLEDRLPYKPQQMIDAVVGALAGPDPDRAAIVSAHAAYAAINDGAHALVVAGNGVLDPADRAHLLAAAVRALGR
jgi:AcrR family transcriptional regulator